MTWQCIEGCRAECCGMVPLQKELAKQFEYLAQVKPQEIHEWNGRVFALTEDFLCVFLNRNTRKCVIHEHRPQICRDYGQKPELPCPYVDLKGNKRSPAKVRRTIRFINKKVDFDMKRIERMAMGM